MGNLNLMPTADILSNFIGSLQSLTEGAENDFMLIGHGLQAVHANVTDLTGLMHNTAKRIDRDAAVTKFRGGPSGTRPAAE